MSGNRSITYSVTSDYITDEGFPVAVFIEKGRKKYVILAPEPTPERPNPHLRWKPKGQGNFKYRYAKKVTIPKYNARWYVRNGVRDGRLNVQKRINKETDLFVLNILKE